MKKLILIALCLMVAAVAGTVERYSESFGPCTENEIPKWVKSENGEYRIDCTAETMIYAPPEGKPGQILMYDEAKKGWRWEYLAIIANECPTAINGWER